MKKITPIKKFDFAIERAEHLLFLYEVRHNRRQRRPSASWMTKFKKLMIWRKSDSVLRIDAKDSILILRNPSEGMTITRFEHKYLEELLRAAVVASVSALDKFMHDWALDVTFNLLQGKEDKIPKDLKKLEVPALESLKSMKQIRKDKNARPGSQI